MDEPTTRHGIVTAVNEKESADLRRIWERTKDARRDAGLSSQAAFGERYDIGNQAAVGFFLNGKRALSLKAARGFARGLGCKVADFSPRLAKEVEQLTEVANAPDPLAQLDGTEGHLIGLFRAFTPAVRAALMKEAERLRDGGEPLPVEAYRLATELMLLTPAERAVAYSLALSAIENRDTESTFDWEQARAAAKAEAREDSARKPNVPASAGTRPRRVRNR